MIAGSLAKPESASTGVSRPVAASAMQRQHRRDVDADALADEEGQRAGDDGQEDVLFLCHGRRWRDFTRQAATLYYPC